MKNSNITKKEDFHQDNAYFESKEEMQRAWSALTQKHSESDLCNAIARHKHIVLQKQPYPSALRLATSRVFLAAAILLLSVAALDISRHAEQHDSALTDACKFAFRTAMIRLVLPVYDWTWINRKSCLLRNPARANHTRAAFNANKAALLRNHNAHYDDDDDDDADDDDADDDDADDDDADDDDEDENVEETGNAEERGARGPKKEGKRRARDAAQTLELCNQCDSWLYSHTSPVERLAGAHRLSTVSFHQLATNEMTPILLLRADWPIFARLDSAHKLAQFYGLQDERGIERDKKQEIEKEKEKEKEKERQKERRGEAELCEFASDYSDQSHANSDRPPPPPHSDDDDNNNNNEDGDYEESATAHLTRLLADPHLMRHNNSDWLTVWTHCNNNESGYKNSQSQRRLKNLFPKPQFMGSKLQFNEDPLVILAGRKVQKEAYEVSFQNGTSTRKLALIMQLIGSSRVTLRITAHCTRTHADSACAQAEQSHSVEMNAGQSLIVPINIVSKRARFSLWESASWHFSGQLNLHTIWFAN